jgi:hypothetical protein
MAAAPYFDLVREMKDAYNQPSAPAGAVRSPDRHQAYRTSFLHHRARFASGFVAFSNKGPPACVNTRALRTISLAALRQS